MPARTWLITRLERPSRRRMLLVDALSGHGSGGYRFVGNGQSDRNCSVGDKALGREPDRRTGQRDSALRVDLTTLPCGDGGSAMNLSRVGSWMAGVAWR
jgi:hypothetical protein